MEILSPKAIAYAEDCQEELEQLLLALCRIPAPSHQEDQRASFCRDWFIQAGGKDTYIDEAKNVVCPWHLTEDKPVVVFMAHTDTVFPDLAPFEPVVTDERISCPGVGDDTANLAVLMLAARYIMQNELPIGCGVLFVANSCEEGLGNLKGSRQLLKDYGSRIRAVISFDGYLEGITHQAVGSHRYRVEIRTPGGHSYASFGKPNAIHLLSELIHTLYQVKIPEGMGYTTYNVGCIEGGTSVNTIAQNASMLYEYRSDDRRGLQFMQQTFEQAVANCREKGIDIRVEKIGERPCSGNPDPGMMEWLEKTAQQVVKNYAGFLPSLGSGSTDCNIPLSMDIPAICPGVVSGGGAHTREEYILRSSLLPGLKVGIALIASFMK